MALLVPNIGELESLRYLLNATHEIPRNLILKLYTSNTTPAEGDVPSQTAYYGLMLMVTPMVMVLVQQPTIHMQ